MAVKVGVGEGEVNKGGGIFLNSALLIRVITGSGRFASSNIERFQSGGGGGWRGRGPGGRAGGRVGEGVLRRVVVAGVS